LLALKRLGSPLAQIARLGRSLRPNSSAMPTSLAFGGGDEVIVLSCGKLRLELTEPV
jgi:hypothetical protein